MIFHFWIIQVHFVFCKLNLISFFLFIQNITILFIIIVFRLGCVVVMSSSSVSCQDFFCSLPRDQSQDEEPRLGTS